jgi:hypothetical protein
MVMKRHIAIFSVVVLFLLLFSFSSFAAPYQHTATGLVFPDRLASLQKDKVTDFEKDHPGLGVGIGYYSHGITLNIFIYNNGIKDLMAGPDDPTMKKHFSQVIGDVFALEQRGKYVNLQKLSESEVVLGSSPKGPKALSASFSFVANNVERLSKLYLICYKKHFVKIRYTCNKNMKQTAEKTLARVLNELAVMMQK